MFNTSSGIPVTTTSSLKVRVMERVSELAGLASSSVYFPSLLGEVIKVIEAVILSTVKVLVAVLILPATSNKLTVKLTTPL